MIKRKVRRVLYLKRKLRELEINFNNQLLYKSFYKMVNLISSLIYLIYREVASVQFIELGILMDRIMQLKDYIYR